MLSRVPLLATPWTAAYQAPLSMDFPGKSTGVGCHCLLQLHGTVEYKIGEWAGGPNLIKKKWSRSVLSDSFRPCGLWPTRFLCPWDFPGKNNGVGCHCLLPGSSWPRDRTWVSCIVGRLFTVWATREVKSNQSESESEVAQSCPTLCDPVDCSPPGSSIHGILQARILEWVALIKGACKRGALSQAREIRAIWRPRRTEHTVAVLKTEGMLEKEWGRPWEKQETWNCWGWPGVEMGTSNWGPANEWARN